MRRCNGMDLSKQRHIWGFFFLPLVVQELTSTYPYLLLFNFTIFIGTWTIYFLGIVLILFAFIFYVSGRYYSKHTVLKRNCLKTVWFGLR